MIFLDFPEKSLSRSQHPVFLPTLPWPAAQTRKSQKNLLRARDVDANSSFFELSARFSGKYPCRAAYRQDFSLSSILKNRVFHAARQGSSERSHRWTARRGYFPGKSMIFRSTTLQTYGFSGVLFTKNRKTIPVEPLERKIEENLLSPRVVSETYVRGRRGTRGKIHRFSEKIWEHGALLALCSPRASFS